MLSFLSLVNLLCSSALLVNAIPTSSSKGSCHCDLKGVQIQLPSNQTTLSVPAGQTPRFVALGVGVQNYTCSSAGTFTSVGALATLFDVSCFAKSPQALAEIPELIYDANEAIPSLTKLLGKTPLKLGQHLFIINPVTNSGIVPRFDFSSSQHNSNAFVDSSKTGDILAPTNPKSNIDWLQLTGFLGGLAKTVFRVNTKAGQPAASCTPNQTASVPYAAIYWFFA